MSDFKATDYILESLCCSTKFEDKNWELDCPNNQKPSLIRAIYQKKQFNINENHDGLYKFSDWLPVERSLAGSGAPITYKSEKLAKHLGLKNLFITFNGYWPEKGANVKTGAFKEYEAYSVCARTNNFKNKVLVVASAGNTARAFAKVCSENKIPLLLCVPQDNIDALWFDQEIDSCVKLITAESGGDYFDAIHLSNLACELDKFYPEGGAKNVARRDGMATSVLSAVTTIGSIPDYYFQAVGSGTGAIAAWEANLRFLEDGRFGTNKMRLMVSQNTPFLPIYDAWKQDSRDILPLDDNLARQQVEAINAKVLSNRKPPYAIHGGLYDALKDTNGDVLAVTNQEALEAGKLFLELEGNDLEPAAAVACASLIKEVEENKIDKESVIMLNITGGGIDKFKNENKIYTMNPDLTFPLNSKLEDIKDELLNLFK